MRDFEYAAGSIPGRHHVGQGKVLNGRNNQDASCCLSLHNALIAVVCDGCSDGRYSEFGAQLGARLIARSLAAEIGRLEILPTNVDSARLIYDELLERVRRDVLRQLQVTAQTLGGAFAETLREYLLFTVVGAVVTRDVTFIFSLGDGVYFVNGAATQLGPFPNNAPPYLAYALAMDERGLRPRHLRFTIQQLQPSSEVESLLIGSDGVDDLIKNAQSNLPGRDDRVGSVAGFWQDERYFQNSDAIRRRLALMNSESVRYDRERRCVVRSPGLLPDDTTMVVIRRTA